MSYVLTFDFETRDPSIALGRGAGWPYKDFDILGAAYKINNHPSVWTEDMNELKEKINGARTIIAHNAQYDLGCLSRLGILFDDKLCVDTSILAKLFDNTLMSYSLDSLAKDFLGQNKDYAALEIAAEELGLRKYMGHMDSLYKARPDLVAQYARQDVDLTYALSQWFKAELYKEALELVPFYSDLLKALVLWRSQGVFIDLVQAEKSSAALHALEEEARTKFKTYCGDINIESTKQVSEAVKLLGLTPGVSKKGGESVDAAWRSLQNHPAIDALSDAKKYQKLRREFVEGLVGRAEDGKIYPEINILGAVETGRFSSSNPNIQQIPKRDGLATSLIRSLIIGDVGEKIYSLDFSSQEPRLQVHYAYLAGSPGADLLRQAFLANVQHDLHQQVADLAGIDRKTAKTINLGISYGMGISKLAATLKLGEKEAAVLLKQYKKMTPYLADLSKKVQASGMEKGYIRTLLGRRLAMDYEKPYKALNKLIQGSAADQTCMALVQAYREKLPILFSVHDEIVLRSRTKEDALKVKSIMEGIAKLEVPSYTDIAEGDSWGG